MTYTTTGDFHARAFSSSLAIHLLTCRGRTSSLRALRDFPLAFLGSFSSLLFRYTTPADACFVRIEIVARRDTVAADNLY